MLIIQDSECEFHLITQLPTFYMLHKWSINLSPQVLATQMAVTYDYDDDDKDEVIASMEFEGNSFPT